MVSISLLSLSLRANKYVILICFWFLFWALSIGKCKFICDILSVVPVVVSCWRLVELHSTALTPPSQRNRERKYDGRKKRLTVLKKKDCLLKEGGKKGKGSAEAKSTLAPSVVFWICAVFESLQLSLISCDWRLAIFITKILELLECIFQNQ